MVSDCWMPACCRRSLNKSTTYLLVTVTSPFSKILNINWNVWFMLPALNNYKSRQHVRLISWSFWRKYVRNVSVTMPWIITFSPRSSCRHRLARMERAKTTIVLHSCDRYIISTLYNDLHVSCRIQEKNNARIILLSKLAFTFGWLISVQFRNFKLTIFLTWACTDTLCRQRFANNPKQGWVNSVSLPCLK